MCYIHKKESYLTIKRNELQIDSTDCMDLENIMLRERNQYKIPHIL